MHRRLDPRGPEVMKSSFPCPEAGLTGHDLWQDTQPLPACLQRWTAHYLSKVSCYYLQSHYCILLCFTLSQQRQHLHPPGSHLIFSHQRQKNQGFSSGSGLPTWSLNLLPLSSLVPVGTGSGNWVWVWGKAGMQLQGSHTNAPA